MKNHFFQYFNSLFTLIVQFHFDLIHRFHSIFLIDISLFIISTLSFLIYLIIINYLIMSNEPIKYYIEHNANCYNLSIIDKMAKGNKKHLIILNQELDCSLVNHF